MKKITFAFLFILFSYFSFAQQVYITGYVDSSCPQAKGRTLEIYVSGTVNLSAWNLKRQSNGNGYTNNISINDLGTLTDEFAYITNDEDILQQEFEIGDAKVLQTGAINDNGDDAFQIVDQFGNIIDRFGEDGVQPTNGSSWYHRKTYYYRKNGESPNQGNFDPDNWIFGAIDLLVGEGNCNNGQAFGELVPFGSFDPNLCEPVSDFPFTQNFENSLIPTIHNCETLENAGNGNDWQTASINQNGFSGKVLQYKASENSANAWFFTRGIQLEANTDYILEFKYGNNDPLSTEKLKAGFGTAQNSAEMTILSEFENIHSGMAKHAQVIFNVSEENTYYFGFNAFSDANQNELFLDDIKIDIAPLCLAPVNLQTNQIGIDTAEISWEDHNINNDSWELIYGEMDFNPDNEGETFSVQNEPGFILENLNPGSTYEVYVRSQCDNNEESNYSTPLIFTTLCEAETTYAEDFELITLPEIPFCSRMENGSAGNFWETKEVLTNGFNGNVLTYQAHPNHPALVWFFTSGIELEAGTLYQLNYMFGNNQIDSTEKLKVAYGNAPVAEEMNTEMADYTQINQAQAQFDEHIFEVDEDGIYYFGFLAYSDAHQGELYLDEIEIDLAPSCLRPTAVEIDNITANTAEVSWTDANQAGDYQIIYGEYGFDPNTEGEIILQQGSANVGLEDLESGTTYQVYVKNICSDQEESEFSFVTMFMTDCTLQQVPYSLDFEKAILPEIPNCTEVENLSQANQWETYQESEVLNSKVLRYESHPNHSANTWFYLPGIQLEAHQHYELTYTYANSTSNTNYFEKLKVGYGTSTDAEAMQIIADHPHISGGESTTETLVFTVNENGIYYIGFNAYSNFKASSLYLDDIQLDFGPDCPAPTNIYYSNLTHHSVDFEWESLSSINQWEIRYGSSGFNVESGNYESVIIDENTLVHLDDLQAASFYDFYVRSICAENENSLWEGPKTFKTKILPPQNNEICDAISLNLNEECTEAYTTIGAYSQEGEPSACFAYPGKTVWFSFEAPENGEVNIETFFYGGVLTSQVSVFEAPEDCEDPESFGTEIACAGYGSALFMEGLTAGNTYFIQVAANSNKEGDFCIEIKSDSDMSVDDAISSQFKFYPNPVENRLYLEAETLLDQVIIFDLQGKKILEESPNTIKSSLDMSRLNAGIYMMKVQIQGQQKFFKVVKK